MKLDDAEVESRLTGLKSWVAEHGALVRTYTFATFADAIAFVTRLAFDAEAADHHPDLEVSYRRVKVRWATHSAGGITDKDFEGVRQSDAIAERLGLRA